MTIVIAGGSALSSTLAKRLLALGHTVIVVATHAPVFTHEHLYFINCDIEIGPLPFQILEHTDALIAFDDADGAESIQHLIEGIVASTSRPSVFVCTSSLAKETNLSEKVQTVAEYGVRVVIMRTIPSLSDMLSIILPLGAFGFLLRPNKSTVPISWIHEDDLVNAYIFAIQTTTLQGTIDVVAPTQTSAYELIDTVAQVYHKHIVGTLPEWIARRLYRHSYEWLTTAPEASPKRLLDKGFEFQYPDLEGALVAIRKVRHAGGNESR